MAAIPGHPDIETVIGANIRALRLHRHCTQAALARAVGITFQQLQKYENGTNRLTAGRLYAMARHLGVPFDCFFHGLEGADCAVST